VTGRHSPPGWYGRARRRVPRWYRRLSLRVRMIILTTVVVTAVVAAGGVLIGMSVRGELLDSADEAARSWAAELVSKVESAGTVPSALPAVQGDEDAAVQVVQDGRVLAATENLDGAAALDLPTQPVGGSQMFEVEALPLVEAGPYRVAARGVETPTGTATIFVAIPVEDVYETVGSATRVGTIGLALLVLALCGAMWVVIGRTLAPVEGIRRRAEAISGHHLDHRVPEPVKDDEIGRLARTVNAMLGRLQDSADQQRRFVADAAHELRNPIASLRSQLETARAGNGNGRADPPRPGLMTETLRMQTLVDQLLLLARSDAGSLPPASRAVDLDDIVEAAVAAQPEHPYVSIDLSNVRPVQVIGHGDLLEQVVRNLVDNAVHYAATRIEVALSAEEPHAVLTVDDDGPGVPEQRRGDVFGRFMRLDHSRDRGGGGVGLGLAIVADIVASHEGTVEVLHSPLGGARFRVRLPLPERQRTVDGQRRRSPAQQ